LFKSKIVKVLVYMMLLSHFGDPLPTTRRKQGGKMFEKKQRKKKRVDEGWAVFGGVIGWGCVVTSLVSRLVRTLTIRKWPDCVRTALVGCVGELQLLKH